MTQVAQVAQMQNVTITFGTSMWSKWQLLAQVRRRTKQRCTNCNHVTEGNLGDFILYLAWDTTSSSAPNKQNTRTFTAAEVHERYARMFQCSHAGAVRFIPKLPLTIKDTFLDVAECAECLPLWTPEPDKFLTLQMPVMLAQHKPKQNPAEAEHNASYIARKPFEEEMASLRKRKDSKSKARLKELKGKAKLKSSGKASSPNSPNSPNTKILTDLESLLK